MTNTEKSSVCICLDDSILSDGISALLEEKFDIQFQNPEKADIVISDEASRNSSAKNVPDSRIIMIGSASGYRVRFQRPFENSVLVKAVEMIAEEQMIPYKNGNFIINAEERSISKNGITAKLSENEFKLFSLLKSRPGHPVSRAETAELWSNADNTNIYDVYVCFLRKKLRPVLGSGVIISVRGQGYMLREDIF